MFESACCLWISRYTLIPSHDSVVFLSPSLPEHYSLQQGSEFDIQHSSSCFVYTRIRIPVVVYWSSQSSDVPPPPSVAVTVPSVPVSTSLLSLSSPEVVDMVEPVTDSRIGPKDRTVGAVVSDCRQSIGPQLFKMLNLPHRLQNLRFDYSSICPLASSSVHLPKR